MKTDIAVVTAHRTTSSLFNFGLANEEYSSLKCFAVIPLYGCSGELFLP